MASALTSARNPLLVSIVALAVVFGLLPPFVSTYEMSLANEVLIFALLAMSIDVLAGYAGRVSLGHGAIFGISTYVVIYWTSIMGGSAWVGCLLGIAAATLAAGVFALLAARVSGVYFLLLTLALGMIVWGVPALDERDRRREWHSGFWSPRYHCGSHRLLLRHAGNGACVDGDYLALRSLAVRPYAPRHSR